MHASPHVLFLLDLGKTVESDTQTVATRLWNGLFKDSNAVARGLVGPNDLSPSIVLRPHVNGELFEDYQRDVTFGKQSFDPNKDTDLFDRGANKQFLYVYPGRADKVSYDQNYTDYDKAGVRYVSESQDDRDEHIHDLQDSTEQLTVLNQSAIGTPVKDQPLLSDEAKRLINLVMLVHEDWF